MIHRTSGKTKKSFTLSPEAVAFLEAARKKLRAESTSAVLEEILQSARRAQRRASVEQAVSDYYSGLSSKDQAEQTAWGEFALSQFPGDREE